LILSPFGFRIDFTPEIPVVFEQQLHMLNELAVCCPVYVLIYVDRV